jgi:hypothetical protein
LFLPVVGTFKFKYTGTWEATYAYNRVPDTFSLPDTTYWTPGYAELETRTNNGGGITWVRPFLILRTTSSVPHHRFHIYNADGALWVSHAQSNSVAGAHFEPTLIMSSLPANTYVWVKVMIDSDRVYIRLWLDGDAEPGYWQESTEAVGQTWDERTFDLISVGSAKNDNQEPFDLYIDDVCIAALDHDDCGGGYFSSLMRNETGLYSVAGGAQIDLVYFDDIPALEGDHYTLSGSTITPLTTLDPETQVRARYRLGIS